MILGAPKRKRLGINCRFLSATTVTGVERYADNVLQALIPLALEQGWEVICFVPSHVELPNYFQTGLKLVPSQISESKIGKHLWEQTKLPRLARAERISTLLNLTNTAPVFFDRNVVTIHDVAWLTNSRSVSLPFKLLYRVLIPAICKSAKGIVTVSEQSASDIKSLLLVSESKLTVLHEGIGLQTRTDLNDSDVLQRYDLQPPYFLHVGTFNDRKNLNRLIQAHNQLRQQFLEHCPPLVLAGGKSSHLKDSINSGDAKCLGYVSDHDLGALYRNALGYVTVSLAEGFNLPILEAMAHNIPVVASAIPVHHEVTGGNAVFCDPLEVKSIRDGLELMVFDEQLREKLVAAGSIWCKKFSWSSHAAGILDLIERLELDET